MRDQGRWVIGFSGHACIMLVMIGIFQMLAGVAGMLEGEIYTAQRNYIFDFGIFGWGIVHIGIGIVLIAAGFMLFLGAVWARSIAIVLAAISAVANFMSIPYYPAWSVLILLLNIGAIWALTAHGTDIIDGEEV